MAIIPVNIENLKPDKEYIVTVRSKNGDVNVVSDYADSVRFSTPKDSTIPNAPTGLELAVSFFSVLFKFNVSIDEDADQYEYELYAESQVEIVEAVYQPKSGEIAHRTGFSASNVFLISVESNSSTTDSGSVTNPVKYYGRVRTIDTSGNYSDWSQIVQSGDTPLIDEEYIGSLTAAKITAGTIGAHTIQLNGSSSILQSSNYVPGTSGWSIFGDGSAEFLNVTIGGDSTIENLPSGGGDFETVATNFNNRNDRISTTPNTPTNVAFSPDTNNLDASIDLTITWDFTVDATPTDAQNIDGFAVYLRTSSATNASSITEADLNTNIYEVYLTAEKRSHTFAGISSSYFYKAAIRAYRIVDDDIDSDGIIYSTLANTSERAATTPLIGGTGIKIGSGKIYIGTGNYGNVDTGFYVDSTGDLSLGDKFVWDYSAGTLSITGEISAQAFNILNTSNQELATFGAIFYADWGDPSSVYGASAPALVFDHSSGGGVEHNPSYLIWTQNSGLSSFSEKQALQMYGPKLKAYEDGYIYPVISLESSATAQGGSSGIRIDNDSSLIHLENSFDTGTSSATIAAGSIQVNANGSLALNNSGSMDILNSSSNSSSRLLIRNSFDAVNHSITMPWRQTMTIQSASGYGLTLASNSGTLSGYWSVPLSLTITGTLNVLNGSMYLPNLSYISGLYAADLGRIQRIEFFDHLFITPRYNSGACALKILNSTGGVQSRLGDDSGAGAAGYRPFIGSAFTVGSSVTYKQDLTPSRSCLETLLNTQVYEWRYVDNPDDFPEGYFEDERSIHIFPIAEDLPRYMLSYTETDELLVDTRDTEGFLWKASQEVYHDLNNKIADLEQRLQALES